MWSARVIAFLVMMLTANAASAANALTSLVITGMSPAFDPTVTQYTVPLPANCSVAVAATLGTPTDLLYIQSSPTASGAVRNAYVCGGKKIDIIVYRNWKEVGRYTVTPVAMVVPPPPPPPPPLSGLVSAGLSPSFNPATKCCTLQRTPPCAVPVTAPLAAAIRGVYVAQHETRIGVVAQAGG